MLLSPDVWQISCAPLCGDAGVSICSQYITAIAQVTIAMIQSVLLALNWRHLHYVFDLVARVDGAEIGTNLVAKNTELSSHRIW